jgi:hypothetical protein
MTPVATSRSSAYCRKVFELAVARSERRVGRDHHRSRDESVEDVERVVLVEVADGRDRIDERAAGKDRHSVEQGAFVVIQHQVRPLDRRQQRTVPFHAAAPTAQETKAVSEPPGDLRRCHRAAARCREFDREWDPVEPNADLVDRGECRIVQHDVGTRLDGPAAEQSDRVG